MMRIFVCCCLLVSSLASAQENFGRLFTTPAERINLDYLRKTTKDVSAKENRESVSAAPAEVMDEVTAEPSAPISMQGFVKRSDGKKGTVWINHHAVLESSRENDMQIGKLQNDTHVLSIRVKEKNINLKAGQVYDIEANRVINEPSHKK